MMVTNFSSCAFLDEGNWNICLSRRPYVVKLPVLIVLRQYLPDTFCTVELCRTVLPVKDLNPEVLPTDFTVDTNVYLNLLICIACRNRYSDGSHNTFDVCY